MEAPTCGDDAMPESRYAPRARRLLIAEAALGATLS
jgi:hypothetical protein